jgi:beta-N-acetylhexosaminidase
MTGIQKDAIEAVGELFITGLSGFEVSDETAQFLRQAKIGGVLLFAHNYENPAQVAELTNQIQESRTHLPLWVSVDHEGGRVQRFKKGFTRIPDGAAIGSTQSPQLAFEISELIARELKAVGINLNFCPVADIATNPKNPVIGNRSFGSTPDLVGKMVSAVVRGHLTQGVQPCLKHFPGHGDTSTDSHYALPRIDTPLEILKEREFIPFTKGMRSKCPMIMSAHILNCQLDGQWPATLSSHILQDILRGELGYTGVIISDDMEMKAMADHFGAKEAPVRALQAGCDLLIYRTEAACRLAYEGVIQALENQTLDPAIVLDSIHRVRTLKKKAFPKYQPIVVAQVGRHLNLPEYQDVIEKIEAKSRTSLPI